MDEEEFAAARQEMLAEIAADAVLLSQQIGKIALDERVMAVMGKVPQHHFVPLELQALAYLNRPLPIGFGKTISQPFIVALMTDLLQICEDDVILEIGTGLAVSRSLHATARQSARSTCKATASRLGRR